MASDASFMPSDDDDTNSTQDDETLDSVEPTKIDQNITSHQ